MVVVGNLVGYSGSSLMYLTRILIIFGDVAMVAAGNSWSKTLGREIPTKQPIHLILYIRRVLVQDRYLVVALAVSITNNDMIIASSKKRQSK